MSLSLQDWHTRYTRQARWTKPLRSYLFRKSGLDQASHVLEVGCGTGVLLAEINDSFLNQIYGLDIDPDRLNFAARVSLGLPLTCGDAHQLPYATASYDACFCHYLLLWVKEPVQVLAEMMRVTRPGGAVLLLAEPDYGGRIDYPADLEQLGEWQVASLRQQGAEPEMGRRLAGLCAAAGLVGVETGVLGGEWKGKPSLEDINSEWSIYESDFESLGFSEAERTLWQQLKQVDRSAWESGGRVLFVPTFFAWGRVPG